MTPEGVSNGRYDNSVQILFAWHCCKTLSFPKSHSHYIAQPSVQCKKPYPLVETRSNRRIQLYIHRKSHLSKPPQASPWIEDSPLFVFSIDGPKQNAGSLLTPVSNIDFYALSSGTLGFALHGSSVNHFLIGGYSYTANQILWNKWLLKLPWKAKPRVTCQRA